MSDYMNTTKEKHVNVFLKYLPPPRAHLFSDGPSYSLTIDKEGNVIDTRFDIIYNHSDEITAYNVVNNNNKLAMVFTGRENLKGYAEMTINRICNELDENDSVGIDLYAKDLREIKKTGIVVGDKNKYVYTSDGREEYPLDHNYLIECLKSFGDGIRYDIELEDENHAILHVYHSKEKIFKVKKINKKNNKKIDNGITVGILNKKDGLDAIMEINKYNNKILGPEIANIPKKCKKRGNHQILYIDINDLR